jgi:hypothetical protein
MQTTKISSQGAKANGHCTMLKRQYLQGIESFVIHTEIPGTEAQAFF